MGTNTTYEYTSDGEKMKAKYPSIVIWPVNHFNGGGRGYMEEDDSAKDERLRLPPLNPHLEITYDSLEYRGSFIFRKGSLEQVLFDGGNITVDSLGTPHYHYYVCDHLGSVRAVVGETGTVEHQYGYYPFGALHSKGTAWKTQRYKFCGKELDQMHGINLSDFGARWYDPLLGRFTTIDPMAEKYYSTSPYAYCGNDPVNVFDHDGMDWIYANYSGVHFYYFDPRISSMDDVKKYYYNGEERDNYDIEYKGSEFKMMKQNGEALDLYIFNSDGSFSINGVLANDEIDIQSLHIGSDKTTNMDNKIPNLYGFYLGPTNPVKTNSTGTYSYAVPPIDDLDFAAFMHDKGYDKYGAVGPTGAFFNNKVWKEDLLLAMRSYRSYKQTPSNQTVKRLMANSTYHLFSTLSKIKRILSKIW